MSQQTPGISAAAKPSRRTRRLRRVMKYLVIASALGLLALVAAVLIGYRMVDIPKPNAAFQAETSFVYYADGEHRLGTFSSQDRVNVALADVPDHVQQAVVAAENRTFWTDSGIDPKSIVRAAWANLTSDSTQGASTITQQYVKILYLSQERSWQRKIKEAFLAVKVENSMSKPEILQGYLNTIYFGRGAYGIEAAARAYFRTSASQLNLPQGAALAAVLNSPGAYDPAGGRANREALLARYRYVLDAMAEAGDISAEQTTRFRSSLPAFPRVEVRNELGGPKGHLLVLVEDQLRRQGFSEEEIYGGGLNVVTTFDWQAQQATRLAVRKEAPRIKGDDVHIAIASVEPGTGALRAIYGGPDYVQSQRNWALTGRQPGSSFKPFALAAGLESGVSLFDTVNGNTVVFRDGTTVRNEFGYQYGAISLLRATEVSSNTGYADLTARVKGGPQTVLESATRAGIPADTPGLRANSVIALGTADVRPVDMANAYATFAARGRAAAWYVLERVTDTAGNIRYEHRRQTSQEFGTGVAADVTYALRQVVEDPAGTGTAAQALRCPAAAKTGTAALRPDTVTSAWFVGYTPQLSTAVMYVRGRDGTADLDGVGGLSTFFGGEYPARTWTTYMNQALRGRPCQGFPKPAFVSGASPTPTPTPTPTPSPSPTPTPTPTPTPSPTPSPTPTPTPSPTLTPTPSPSPSPSPTPTPTPTTPPTTPPTPTPTERSTPVAGR